MAIAAGAVLLDTQAMTLADQAIISNDPLVKEITKALHKTWNALKDIPLTTSPSLRQVGVRFTNQAGSLPTINWATVNEEPTVSKGKPKQYEESMYLVRNKIQIDHVLLDQPNNIVDPIEAQVQIFMEAFAYDFNTKFISNDPTSATGDADCFPGLRYRLANPDQFDIPGEMSVNGAGVDLVTAATASAQANNLMAYIQQLLDNMNSPDGDGVTLYVSELMKRRIEWAIRAMGIGAGFDITKDSFDRPVEKYKAATIRSVGRKADGVTSVLGNETAAGVETSSGTGLQSIYAVRYGNGYCTGWQSGPFKPTYLGLSKENGVLHNIVFDWGVGMWVPHVRAIGRVYNIKVA
jgi:hypothetical protein